MREEALNHLKTLVYNKFKQNKNLNYFLIAMGTYYFVDLNGDIDYNTGTKFIDTFITEWDDLLKLTGYGVKWFRDGSVVSDW